MRHFRKLFLMVLFVLWSCVSAYAAPAVALSPDILSELPKLNTDQYNESGAVILLKEVNLKVEKNYLSTHTIRIAGKVLNDAAATAYREIAIPFNAYYEDVTLDFGRVLTPDGKTKKVQNDTIQIKTISGSNVYNDEKLLCFPLPAVSSGAVFEYQFSTKTKRTLMPGKWFDTVRFNSFHFGETSRLDPVRKFMCTVTVPDKEKLNYQLKRATLQPTIVKKAGTVSYTWEAHDIPAIKLEGGMPCWVHEMTPLLEFSLINDWDEFGAWARSQFVPKAEVTPEIAALAKEIAANAKTRRERISALYYYVQSKIKYVSIDLNSSGYAPHPPGQVLENEYGDCKDQGVLLIALLKALDIPAFPVLLDPCLSLRETEFEKKIVIPHFSHLIVMVPDQQGDIWLDTTSFVTPFPLLPEQDMRQPVLVLTDKGGMMLRTPDGNAATNELSLKFDLNAQHTDFLVAMNLQGTGTISEYLKWRMLAADPDTRKDMILRLWSVVRYKGNNTSIEFPSLENRSIPFEGKMQFTAKNVFSDTIDSFAYSGNMSAAFWVLELLNLPAPESRRNDLLIADRLALNAEWICAPPVTGMVIKKLPDNVTHEDRFGKFTANFSTENESLKVAMRYEFKQARIKKEDYKDFYNALTEIEHKAQWSISFVREKKGWRKLFGRLSAPPCRCMGLKDISSETGIM